MTVEDFTLFVAVLMFAGFWLYVNLRTPSGLLSYISLYSMYGNLVVAGYLIYQAIVSKF